MSDERQLTHNSYILTFLNDVELLLDYAGTYLNILVGLNSKYGSSDNIELTNEEKNNLISVANAVRGLVFKTYVRLKSLKLKEKDIKEYLEKINEVYPQFREQQLFEFEVVEQYTTNLNKIFMTAISLNKAKESSKNIVEGLAK